MMKGKSRKLRWSEVKMEERDKKFGEWGIDDRIQMMN